MVRNQFIDSSKDLLKIVWIHENIMSNWSQLRQEYWRGINLKQGTRAIDYWFKILYLFNSSLLSNRLPLELKTELDCIIAERNVYIDITPFNYKKTTEILQNYFENTYEYLVFLRVKYQFQNYFYQTNIYKQQV